MRDFFFGFFYPIRSLGFFFKQPKIILYSIVPIILNLVIYGTIFFFTYRWLYGISEDITGAGTGDPNVIQVMFHALLSVIFFIVLLFICYLLFITLGGLVNAPFEDRISRAVEKIITNTNYETNLGFWKENFLSIKAEFFKQLFNICIIVPIFFLNFVPAVGTVLSSILGITFSFFFNALDYLDYPMTRRFYKLRQKLSVVNSGGLLSYGFGAMAFLMMFLPIINVFFKPVLVVAGTSLFYEKKYFDQIKNFHK
ncbi:MAG: EI24 domain-containing protein [Ignavibacteriae bacterium]|nr:EI24 domain-containing protein [Ignavibacteriota bacterium]MCB0723435.1 EI24 domain-containing protein [Ignavibacteriota bacterium]MCB9243281.1 EI24 domain-containing protein [Ignavibacteriales bacterium]